jgi:hypothetical protein
MEADRPPVECPGCAARWLTVAEEEEDKQEEAEWHSSFYTDGCSFVPMESSVAYIQPREYAFVGAEELPPAKTGVIVAAWETLVNIISEMFEFIANAYA